MAKRFFKVTVPAWSEHNKAPKKYYKFTLIPNNFCTDARLSALPMGHRWLYFGLFMTCGDFGDDTVMISERQVNDLLTSKVGAENALHALQSLQLVTFEILTPLIKEKKEKERKGREEKAAAPPATPPPKSTESKKPAPPDMHWLIKKWNVSRGPFREVRGPISPAHLKKIEARVKERPAEVEWLHIFANSRESDFLRGWAGFDFWWLMENHVNHVKVMEGKYSNGAPKKSNSGLRDVPVTRYPEYVPEAEVPKDPKILEAIKKELGASSAWEAAKMIKHSAQPVNDLLPHGEEVKNSGTD